MSDLDQLIANSKANEAISKKLFEIETEVLTCKSSQDLLHCLFSLIKDKFELQDVKLLLVQPTPISYLLNGIIHTEWHKDNCHQVSQHQLTSIHRDNKPYLSNNYVVLSQLLPISLLAEGESFAMLPLFLEGKLFGSLLFSDTNKDRFSPDLGTLHLEQLAVKVSLCLSNVMIREQLEYMAHYDRLTGVANRRLMEACINEELIRQRRYQVPFSVIFIDCNKFKNINDTYGHDCGDKVLTYVAQNLQELIRENDKCFRYAGDEFVVVLASQGYQAAQMASDRLCNFFINHPMPYNGNNLPITISCGVATSDGENSMDELLKNADEQLYLHKKVSSPC